MHHITLTGLVALATAGVLAASSIDVRGDAHAAAGARGRAFVVTSVTPERNRETLPDLSDPGLNNQITVRFSTAVDPADVIDQQDPVSPLSANCELRDMTNAAVPASGSVYRNVLSIDPFSGKSPVLALGRYTLTLKSSIRSTRGRRLNGGAGDFVSSFFVGSDVYPPVVRGTSPVHGTTLVGLHRAVVVSFDEQVDRSSAGLSVRLEDRSTVPPTTVPARVRLARRGLDVVVTPASRAGYPRGTAITLVVTGAGTATDPFATVLTDTLGNRFTRDISPRWTRDGGVLGLYHSAIGDFNDTNGEFTMTFETRGAAGAARR